MNAVDTVVEKAAECAVVEISHQVGYIIDYKSNRENLKKKLVELSDARNRLKERVSEAEDNNENIHDDVWSWQDSVDKITEEANTFLHDENQATVKCGCCPNPVNRYKLSRQSTELAKSVHELYEKCGFPNGVSYSGRPEEVLKTSAEDYLGLESRSEIVKKIMEKLRGLDTNVIGVYGFSGVGKTTLVEEVYRQAIKEKLFKDVFIVRYVKENPDLVNIQTQIGKKLGLVVPENETQQERVERISRRIKGKTLVILDDVWESIKLEDVGIPNAPECKILFTSRRKMVFRDYRQEDFRLDALDEPETWKLFEKTAGVVVQDPSVRNVAEDAAKKCRGLPLSVHRVASSIKNRSNEEALNHLKSLGNEELTETEYSIIKWSYDQLDNDDLKKLFLLCAITARGNLIYLQDVFKYSMGLGLFKSLNIRKAQKEFDSLVHKLLDFCLLTSDYCIQDPVRDAAFRIATEDPDILFITNGDEEFEEWQNMGLFQRSTMIIFQDCRIPKLPEVLECPELKFFQLCSSDNSLEIPLKFFKNMKELKVLNQTNLKVPSLPLSLQYLTSLQSLCLHRCVLEDIALVGELKTLEVLSFEDSEFLNLPEEIGQLSRLRMLDLNYCSKLKVIFPGVISSLKRLEELRMMKCSFNQWEAKGMASLSELKNLSKLAALAIHIPDANMLPADLFSNMRLERYQILIGDELGWNGSFNNRVNRLLKLKLNTGIQLEPSLEMLLKKSESLYLDKFEGFDEEFDSEDFQKVQDLHVQNNAYIFDEKDEFPNLLSLTVRGCNGLNFLLSSFTARSLERLNYLEISECECMEEIISTKETSEISEEKPNNMFCKLEYLELDNLPNLTRFCCSGSRIEFPCVQQMKLKKCAKLEKFIFDSSCQHVPLDKEIIGERDSRERLETVAQYYLFDEKVRFPSLEILSIKDLPPKFTTLWHPQIDQRSFCRLKRVKVRRCPSLTNIFVPSIIRRLNALSALDISDCESLQRIFEVEGSNVKEIRDTTHQLETPYCQALHSVVINMCNSLKNVFPVSVAKGLQLLQKLTVEHCEVLEEIVAKDEGLETVPKFMFPKVTSLTFQNLPQLRSFFPGSHASMWPLLKTFNIQKCDQVDIFAAESSSFLTTREVPGRDTVMKQPFFLIEKGSFSKLNKLTLGPMDLWYGPPGPAEFLRKLKSIEFCGYQDETKKPGFLPICQNTYWTFTRVKKLELSAMSKQHLWKEECQPVAVAGSSVFPHLETLVVNRCDALVSLTLSTISFRNLKSLEVTGCWDMKYLATYSMAKSLVHLTKLNVTGCVSLIKIIAASDGDEDDAGNYEITFSRLQCLELCNLTKLQHFGLGKCIVPLKPVPEVTDCPIRLTVSSDGVLEKVDVEREIEWTWGQLVSSIRRASSDRLRPYLRYNLCFSRNLYKTRLRLSRIMNQSSQTLLICIFVILVASFYFFLFRS